jgi:hypothetical protein
MIWICKFDWRDTVSIITPPEKAISFAIRFQVTSELFEYNPAQLSGSAKGLRLRTQAKTQWIFGDDELRREMIASFFQTDWKTADPQRVSCRADLGICRSIGLLITCGMSILILLGESLDPEIVCDPQCLMRIHFPQQILGNWTNSGYSQRRRFGRARPFGNG